MKKKFFTGLLCSFYSLAYVSSYGKNPQENLSSSFEEQVQNQQVQQVQQVQEVQQIQQNQEILPPQVILQPEENIDSEMDLAEWGDVEQEEDQQTLWNEIFNIQPLNQQHVQDGDFEIVNTLQERDSSQEEGDYRFLNLPSPKELEKEFNNFSKKDKIKISLLNNRLKKKFFAFLKENFPKNVTNTIIDFMDCHDLSEEILSIKANMMEKKITEANSGYKIPRKHSLAYNSIISKQSSPFIQCLIGLFGGNENNYEIDSMDEESYLEPDILKAKSDHDNQVVHTYYIQWMEKKMNDQEIISKILNLLDKSVKSFFSFSLEAELDSLEEMKEKCIIALNNESDKKLQKDIEKKINFLNFKINFLLEKNQEDRVIVFKTICSEKINKKKKDLEDLKAKKNFVQEEKDLKIYENKIKTIEEKIEFYISLKNEASHNLISSLLRIFHEDTEQLLNPQTTGEQKIISPENRIALEHRKRIITLENKEDYDLLDKVNLALEAKERIESMRKIKKERVFGIIMGNSSFIGRIIAEKDSFHTGYLFTIYEFLSSCLYGEEDI